MDHVTPNLPSRNFEITSAFYAKLGFEQAWKDDGWMILRRDGLSLEFFPHPDLNPLESWFSCCLRLNDLAGFYSECLAADVEERCWGHPRMQPPKVEESGLTIAALIDPDGTLIRLIQN